MMNEIETINGIYIYEEVKFVLGSKKINRDIARKNLLDFHQCLSKNNITFGLIYGTLLGAIREENFIEYDEDTDVFMFAHDREKILAILFELREYNLLVGRYQPNEDLLTIIRDGEYIDIYFFHKSLFGKYVGNGSTIKAKYLENLQYLNFLGVNFYVPKEAESLLKEIYGANWRILIKDKKGSNFGIYLKFKLFFQIEYPKVFKVLSRIKSVLNKLVH